ncbi:MAG: acyl-CoA synthetase [Gemmatimonadales bacterium]
MTADPLFLSWHRHPDRLAIVDLAGHHSYADLGAASGAVASGLLAGAASLDEGRVVYLVPPGFDHVAVQWGIWAAGGIAVPAAGSHPDRELEYLLDDSRAVAAVASAGPTGDRLAPLARARGIRFVETGELLRAAPSRLPPPDPERRALMVYTSGTTGRPKGVVTTHGMIAAQVAAMVEAWGWADPDRSLHVLPLHHIHGIINAQSCALAVGATVEFLPAFDPAAVWNRFASGEITFFTAVPTVYARLIAEWEAADGATRERWSAGAARLRLMCSGSAALPVATLTRWEAMTGQRLLERYGMTEIGMGLSNPYRGERRASTVGQPLPGVDVRLSDEDGRTVAEGQQGQIEIRGPQVFREYWDRPEESRRAFRDGWFLTGDVGMLTDGYYRILGRQSVDIIKSAGYKISALEIEEVLREHPAIRDCAVVGIADPDLGERIGAALIGREGADPPSDAELRAWLKERLAPYKVPRAFLTVTDLPRNAMGKVTKAEVRRLF